MMGAEEYAHVDADLPDQDDDHQGARLSASEAIVSLPLLPPRMRCRAFDPLRVAVAASSGSRHQKQTLTATLSLHPGVNLVWRTIQRRVPRQSCVLARHRSSTQIRIHHPPVLAELCGGAGQHNPAVIDYICPVGCR
jgi:hypothetical protein